MPAGRFMGHLDGDVIRLRGIRYARAERFEPPQAVQVDAVQRKRPGPVAHEPTTPETGEPHILAPPIAPQLPSTTFRLLVEGAFDGREASEDCQRLSITTPADLSPDERLPVMVWIHGGAYAVGAGDLDIHDPKALVAEQRVIVVTVTFRLGMLGFHSHPGSVPANLGLMDLILALRWIQENIEGFGGSPGSVTLFGQSAGGDAIAHLMIAEGASGLFRRAIIQSAPLGIASKRSRMLRYLTATVGDPRNARSIAELLRLQHRIERAALRFGTRGAMPFGTEYGHAPLPAETERDAAWRAAAPSVDLLIGWTTRETDLYLPVIPGLLSLLRIPALRWVLRQLLVRPTTFTVYTRDSRRFARRHRAAGGRAVSYELAWSPRSGPVGAAHMVDVPLLLGAPSAWERTSLLGASTWADVDRAGRRIRRIWADFARTGTVEERESDGDVGVIEFDWG